MKISCPGRLMSVMLTLLALATNANDFVVSPKRLIFSSAFENSLLVFEKLNPGKNDAKVCACQLMLVKSGHEAALNIAVFSEKISSGDLSAEFAIATQVLEEERKHMKSFFYNKVKVIAKEVVATDCRTMYNQMKVQYADLKMFELLDADAITRFKSLNK